MSDRDRIESTNPKFPTTWTPNPKYSFAESPKKPKHPKGIWKLVRAAFIGLGAGILVCVLQNSGTYFLPVFGGVTLLFWVGYVTKSK